MEDVSLDDMIKQKKMENRRNKGRRNRDNDGDVEMGSSRGPGYSTRGPRQRNRNRSTPYKKNKYTTSGDSSKAWKHDFYGKEDEEIEETGWRKKEKKEDDLLDGTSVIIDNLHWEITEAELKVYMFYLQSFYSIRRRSNDHLLFFIFFFIFFFFLVDCF